MVHNAGMRYEPRGLILTGVAVALTLVIGLGGAIWLWTQRELFATNLHSQWGSLGHPDNYTPFVSALALNVLVSTAMPLFLAAMGVVSNQMRQTAPLSAAVATFLGVLLHGAVWTQRGLGLTTMQTPSLGHPLLWAALCTIVVTLSMLWLARVLRVPAAPNGEKESTLPGVRQWAGWSGHTRWSPRLGLQVAALAIGLGVQFAAALATGSAALVVTSFLAAGLVLPRAPLAAALVRIEPGGVWITGYGFMPWQAIEIDRVSRASVVSVDPRQYGGIGRRTLTDGTEAFITGRGDALRIDLNNGERVLVTLVHADVAAQTLNGLVERRWERYG